MEPNFNSIWAFLPQPSPATEANLTNRSIYDQNMPLAGPSQNNEGRIIDFIATNRSIYDQKMPLAGPSQNNEGRIIDLVPKRTSENNQTQRNWCGFCKKNRSPPEYYMQHRLKDDQGNVVCPILYNYVCDLCGLTGSKAHTRNYCPLNKNRRSLTRQPTPSMSNGKPRYLN